MTYERWPVVRPSGALANNERYWPFAIVRATRHLHPSAKLLYGLLLDLDRPQLTGVGGASMGSVELARQLGLSPDYTKGLRLHLCQVGLLERLEVSGLREALWFPTLPTVIERLPPQGSKLGIKRSWLHLQAEVLDREIEATEAKTTTPITQARERAVRSRQRDKFGAHVPPPQGEIPPHVQTDKGARAPLSEHETPASSPTSVTSQSSETSSVTLTSRSGHTLYGLRATARVGAVHPAHVGDILAELGLLPRPTGIR